MKKRTRIISLLLCLTLLFGIMPISTLAAGAEDGFANFTRRNEFSSTTFEDVTSGDWCFENVKAAYQLGLMIGDSLTTFNPDGDMKISETITIAARLHSIFTYGKDEFEASDPWYDTYVDYALTHGIIASEYSDYNAPATRAEFAYILASALPASALEAVNKVADGRIPDVDTNASYAEAIYMLYRAGVLVGNDTIGTFLPESNISRGEVAAIASRMAVPSLRKDIQLGEDYIVTFDTNGGSSKTTEQVVFEGELVTQPKNPSNGMFYTFEGWFTAPTGGTKFDFNTPILSDITLYAHWDFNETLYYWWMNNLNNDQPDEPDEPEEPAEPDNPTEPDDQSVPDEIAALFGFDTNNNDADEDGLSNYNEIYVVGTDPMIADTDEDGINDAEDDSDGDRLSNVQEIGYGTNPLKSDTDHDGLSDYEEINEYGTDPCKEDTDGDGLNDGDEIILGLNPLLQSTDGETLDFEREFTQQLNEENISDALLDEDNDAVPSLTVTQSGNINNEISIEETASKVFSDSRAIVGAAIDIHGSSIDEGTLSFTLNDADMTFITTEDTGEVFSTLLICKYNDDGTTEYLETEYDGGTISADIDSFGTYFVLNVKNLFDELGLALPTISDVSTLSDPAPLMLLDVDDEENAGQDNDNGAEQISIFAITDESNSVAASADTVKVTTASSGVMAQADIVFIVDTTGSMGDEIDNVKNNMSYFVDALNAKGISAALALIDYEDITVDGLDSTRVHKNGSSNWFYNVEDYKTAIANLSLGYGGDTPECAVDALETARLLDMRASAGKIFILVTDADYKVDNRYDIPSMTAEIELLKNAGVNCSVVSPSSEQSTYYNLYTETNGVWANIYGNFYEELMVLADKIGSDIVGDGYWIYLDGPIPVPVRLDAMPEEGSTVDTDKDGIPDIEELEGATPSGYVDLDALVTAISRGVITSTDYGMVMMYKYTSSPVEGDSDYDGLKDADESNPIERLDNSFDGKMLGYYDVANANYTFDYRQFFNSASTYSKDLCSASLMFANTIYNDCGFSYDSGLEITDITKLMQYHGFENVIDYKLANGYNNGEIFANPYNDDDISEIGIGYHEVTHNGVTKTVLAVIIRGTNGTIEEWSSNFDMGDTETWNVDIHKGFYITEERIKTFVAQYVDAYLSDAEGLTYWITGHSRGAALANILAARLIDEGNSVYAYTFATPSTTIRENRSAAKYNSIFNFANTSDFVTYVPLQEWDFGPFGITYFMSIEDSGLEGEWSKQTGASNYNALSMSVIRLATSRIAKSCCANWDEVHDRAGSQDIDDEQYGYISDRAMRYCDLTERTSIFGNHKGYKLYPSTAFIFQLGAEMLAGSDVEKDNVVALLPELWNSRYTGVILLFLGDAALNWSSFEDMELSDTLVGDGHAPATYYVLTQN